MNFHEASAHWAALSLEDRTALIRQVNGDIAMAGHAWAGLPPEAHTALIAVMAPPAEPEAEPDEPAEADTAEADTEHETTPRPGRKRKS